MDTWPTMIFRHTYKFVLAGVTAVVLAACLAIWSLSADRPVHDVYSLPRSSQWRSVRGAYLKLHPNCEACGADGTLGPIEVHHVVPFSTDPSLELDPTNLISLCRAGNNCHLNIGHHPRGSPRDWSKSNPDVRADAKRYHHNLHTSPYRP